MTNDMPGDLPDHLALTERRALPDGMAFLLAEYPREAWDGHPNNGEWCSFWLARHKMFRDIGAGLVDACEKLDAGEVDGVDFHDWFMPRASFYLGELDTHHKVEEYHYFPVMAQADARMERGIALLESDHEVIHDALRATYELIVGLQDAVRETPDNAREYSPRLRDALVSLDTNLRRHLDDEEDLVIPLILDRGEGGLGMH